MKNKQLHQLYLQCSSVSTDTRTIEKNAMFFALKGKNFNGNIYAEEAIRKGAKYAIIDEEKYKNSQTILVEDTLKTLQELAMYHRNYLKTPIIALTGSNGKTTTKELIKNTLQTQYQVTATKGNLNNHIGVPLTLLAFTKATQIGIVEMGANHLGEIQFLCKIAQPDYGYITNFGKAHLEGFGSEEGVVKGKAELYQFLMQNNKNIFINADDEKQLELVGNYIKKIGFSQNKSNYYRITLEATKPYITLVLEKTLLETHLVGNYNFNNAAAAALIAKYFNVSLANIKEGIESYIPNNNRSQILVHHNAKIILDAYNANPSSMKAVLEEFKNDTSKNKIIVLGDMFELGKFAATEHQEIVNLAESLQVDALYLIGNNFYTTTTKNKTTHKYKDFSTFKQAFVPSSKPTTYLIKGSRGMALERCLDVL